MIRAFNAGDDIRVAYDHQIFTSQKYGGISRYFARLAPEVSLLGPQVGIFTPKITNEYLNQVSPDLVPSSRLCQLLPSIPWRFRRWRLAVDSWTTRQRLLRWKPDVVHETYYQSKTVAPARTAVVVTVYDMIHELFAEQFAVSNPTSHLKRMAVERADHVICISENTRRDLIEIFNIPFEKTSVIYLASDHVVFAPIKDALLRRPFIFFVGDRGGYKNFSNVVRAMAGSTSLRRDFDLVAFGGPEFTEEEEKLILKVGLSRQQIRRETGDDRKLQACYREASVFVYPSLYEGFGLPPLEAMAAGCPVAASNASCIPEVAGNGAEFFLPSDPGSIARTLERVAYDSELRAALIKAGHERTRQFSWKKCAEETLEVYRAVS